MATGSEVIAKPDRSPDFVAPAGHAFWWSEMVMMHVYGHVFKMFIDQTDGHLCYTIPRYTTDEVVSLPPVTKELYDKWWHECFESKFLGDDGD